ncbi:MAG: NAD(P)H-dependent oxidoreductase [Methylacidiphilales bacterium]|nr:NAD(P)H-dependent oxidoreductase [Candidatus Methylacidiphilales bacterium]MDW8349376.1 NAD(P)H-dependent oxidoreductase [Verrucomicrobiae bacterium]
MNPISPDTLLSALRWRYATKQFDPTRKIEDPLWHSLEQTLILTPSSYGLQPWKFLVITDPALRAELRTHSWHQPQVTDCSHYVVFAAKIRISTEDVAHFIETIAHTRAQSLDSLEFYRQMILKDVVNGPRAAIATEWAIRQTYIALGNFITAAALLGIDTCPMEGIDPEAYNRILNLPAIGYTTAVACAAGYRSPNDKYASAPKVRFPPDTLIIRK